MNRKVLGGVLALAVVVIGVWFFAFRGNNPDATGSDDPAKRNAKVELASNGAAPVALQRNGAMRWSLDADPDGPLRMEGQVLGPDGKGVGGAEVWLASVPPKKATANDDGSFFFEKLVGRTYSLTATSVDDDLIGGPVSYKLAANSDPVIIRLSEGAGVTATVIDDAKAPIAGAEVRLGDVGGRTAKTDQKGTVTIKPVHPGYVAVQATAGGYAPNTGFATVGTAGITGAVTITLHKGFALQGRVIDEAGKPIAKAKVYASGAEWAGDWSPEDAGDDKHKGRDVTTDDKGEFSIPALANGSHNLVAVDGEHAPGHTPVTVADRALTGVEITMKDGGSIAGTVVDKDKRPVAYVPVKVVGSGSQIWTLGRRQAITDKDGKFELRGLVRTKLQARAESDKAASELVPVDLTTVAAKKDLVLTLDVTGTISGIVVDDKGAPVPEVQVNAFPDIMGGAKMEGFALADMSSAITDGAGGFTITGLPDGGYKLWPNRGSATREWGQNGTGAKTGDKTVRLVLSSPGMLIGKLEIDGGGAPKLAFVHVGYQAPVPAQNGAFAIKDLAPGKYHVTFRGAEFAELQRPEIEITAGKTTDLGTIKLFHGRRLSGKVVDSGGTPVPNAKVKLADVLYTASQADDQAESWEEISGVRSSVTDQDGAFTIIGIPQRATNAMAESPRGRSLAVPIPDGTDDPPPVTLALRGFGSISGKVVLKGAPQPGVTIGESSKGGGAQVMFGQTDDNGNFNLPKVPEGTHVLQAMQTKMMAFKATSVTVSVTAGKETKVTIDIPVGTITLAVTIKPLPNQKVDSAQVFLFNGSVIAQNAKQLTDSFMAGGVQGMKIWLGSAFPPPEFEELLAGDYSVCTIPITGNIADPAFQQALQANAQLLKVYCKQVKVTASPNEQKTTHEVPSMEPLPKT